MTDLGHGLDAAVASGPTREAIVDGDRRISYGELAAAAEALAGRLRAAGVAPGDRVALILPNVPEFAVALFGIWRAGAVALPLHAASTPTEIARALEDADVRAVLATTALEPALRGARSVAPAGAALTQYSTGQGGAPKRVTRTHRELLREVASVRAALGVGPEDRILGVAPLFHSYGLVNALLCALTSGAALVLLEGADLLPRDLLRALAAERITGLPGVPFLFDAVVGTRLREPVDLGALRYCTSAGAPLSPDTARRFAERFGVPVFGLYGATEVGVISVDRAPGAPGTVGFPIDGVEVTIVDGEVVIRSHAAPAGYDRPGPDSRFVGGAFVPGDLGRFDPDGRLVLTGRRRGFVNVGGNKVDPGEVEAVLRALDGVADAAVVGLPDPVGGERLKAVVVADASCDRARLLAHCRAHLAPYKVPRTFEVRSQLPRSPLGKVLRKALLEEPTEPS